MYLLDLPRHPDGEERKGGVAMPGTGHLWFPSQGTPSCLTSTRLIGELNRPRPVDHRLVASSGSHPEGLSIHGGIGSSGSLWMRAQW